MIQSDFVLYLLLEYTFVSPKLRVPPPSPQLPILTKSVYRSRLPQIPILSDLGPVRTSQQSQAHSINGQGCPLNTS